MSKGLQRTYLFTKMVGAESEQDFKDLTNEIVEYISEKEARIARLEQGIDAAYQDAVLAMMNDDARRYKKLLYESPQQSLAHIQADAVENVLYSVLNLCSDTDNYRWDFIVAETEKVIKQLREADK